MYKRYDDDKYSINTSVSKIVRGNIVYISNTLASFGLAAGGGDRHARLADPRSAITPLMKLELHPAFKSVSGMMDDVMYRQLGGQVIMQGAPRQRRDAKTP